MELSLLGLGTAVPQHTMSQEEATLMSSELVCQSDRQQRIVKTLFRRSGVLNRHTCVPHRIAYRWLDVSHEANGHSRGGKSLGPTTAERMRMYADHAGPLAVSAAESALRQAQTPPEEITHLITVSCTGFVAPGVDYELIEWLQLPRDVQRLHIGYMGCHAAINGLRGASGMIAVDPQSRVLLCAVELCSLHYRFCWDSQRIIGNALFSDGAAAIVAAAPRYGAESDWSVTATGSYLLPDCKDAITWRIGDHGFEMTLANTVPEAIELNLRAWLADWLGRHNLTIDDIGSWAIHPGGPRILEAVERSLGLGWRATSISHQVLEELGNMSSPTVLFIIQRLIEQDAPRPCVALGFGPGVVAEVALLG